MPSPHQFWWRSEILLRPFSEATKLFAVSELGIFLERWLEMTLQQWQARMDQEAYTVEVKSKELAVAYKIDPPQGSYSMQIPTILFRVYYKGEERSEYIYMMTDVGQRNPRQWYPNYIRGARVVSGSVKVEIMAALGPYTLDFNFK